MVDVTLMRVRIIGWILLPKVVDASDSSVNPKPLLKTGCVAETVFTQQRRADAPAEITNPVVPSTSQSPAVRLIEVTLAFVLFVRETGEACATPALTYSPMLPAFALSLVVVPTIPLVLDGVNVPVDESVVNAPVLAAVLPIGPGEEKRDVNPAPLTVELADSVVKAPVEGVVLPTAVLFRPLDADSVVKAPVLGVVFPTAVLLIPPVALNPPVCAHAPVPLVDVMPLTPAVKPPVTVKTFVKLVKASLAKPIARTVDPHVMYAFLFPALRSESMNCTVGLGLL